MPIYHIQPQDLLFFRDARPMESQSPGGGHGARWPHPAVFFDALHAALWRAFPDAAAQGFTDHSFYRKENGMRVPKTDGGAFFQTLATAGPFPVRDGQWLFPAPADVQPGGGLVRPITRHRGESDLPPPLKYPLGSTALPSKDGVPSWWSKCALQAYLTGGLNAARQPLFDAADLFAGEWTTGIGMDPATSTQDGERIYSAQYLRLRDEVRLGLWAALPESAGFDGLNKLLPADGSLSILVAGGQQRACHVERRSETDLTLLLPVSQPLPDGCTRLKWVLLSPAVFPAGPDQKPPGGWLPTWIDSATGTVRLTQVRLAPSDGKKTRSDRRTVQGQELLRECRLVAACVPKPIPITGWTESLHVPQNDPRKQRGPRATLLAVPAGAVYYFECETAPAAQALWQLLSWHGNRTSDVNKVVHRRSSLLGEKGFGLGVCGTWEFIPGGASA